MEKIDIYAKSDFVLFMNTATSGTSKTWTRMQGFTSNGGKQLNTKTYTRQYTDEPFERETTIGYAPKMAYNFDRIVDNSVHNILVAIHDEEKIGQQVEILTVNKKTNDAKVRVYDVNPENEGDSTDAYTYSGTFSAASEQVVGTATISSDGKTATFTEAD